VVLENTYNFKEKKYISKFYSSSSECERGFSQMNLIVNPARSSLSVKTIVIFFIKIVVSPLTQLDPTKHVRLWLLREHHSAVDTKSKERNISRVEQNLDYILRSKCSSIIFLSLM
jgi:hypothetical protein